MIDGRIYHLIEQENGICFLRKDNGLRNNLTNRVTELENRMVKVEAISVENKATLATMNDKLDQLVEFGTLAQKTGNWFVNNLPRIVTGLIGGLVAAGIISSPLGG